MILENLGTRSFPTEYGIGHAIDFHNLISTVRKEARLEFLRKCWMDQVRDIPGLKFYASQLKGHSYALMTFGIDGKESGEMVNFLFQHYKLHTTGIKHEQVEGVRVTPHVYTSLKELDILAQALHQMA